MTKKRIDLTPSKSDYGEDHIEGSLWEVCVEQYFLVNNLQTLFLICNSDIAVCQIGNPLCQNNVIEA